MSIVLERAAKYNEISNNIDCCVISIFQMKKVTFQRKYDF